MQIITVNLRLMITQCQIVLLESVYSLHHPNILGTYMSRHQSLSAKLSQFQGGVQYLGCVSAGAPKLSLVSAMIRT
jgi:hypothetical protein